MKTGDSERDRGFESLLLRQTEYSKVGFIMETRTITQVKLYKLVLNNVHDCAEGRALVAISYTEEALKNWYADQLAPEGYRDNQGYYQVFKKDSALYNFNPTDLSNISVFGHGIFEEWVNEDDMLNILSRFHGHIIN